MIPPLKDALEAFNAASLGQMLLATGVSEVPRLKDDKIALWLDMVGDPERIQRALQRLTEPELRSLQALQARGGELRTDRYRSLLLQAKLVSEDPPARRGYGLLARAMVKPSPGTPSFGTLLEKLMRSGLVWTHTLGDYQQSNAKLNFDGGRYVYIPNEVAPHLPPPPDAGPSVPQVTTSLEGSARTGQRDLYLLWSAARETPLTLLNSGLLRQSDLKRVAGQLLVSDTVGKGAKESDFRRVLFLRHLLTALSLLIYDGAALAARPDPLFFRQSAIERVRLCYEHWLAGPWWNELWRTFTAGVTSAMGDPSEPAPPRIAEARRKVVDCLMRQAGRAPDEWIAVDDISSSLQDRDDEFLLGWENTQGENRVAMYRSYGSRYRANPLGWAWYGRISAQDPGWSVVERVFIEGVLCEGLFWLGLVDLGYAEPQASAPRSVAAPGRPLAVRLTDMGRWLLLNQAPPTIPEETGRVVVQPNFHIFAFDPISDAVLARLDSFAMRQNAERAIEYILSRESVYRAQQAGQTTAEISAWLEQSTGASLPQNVARSLAEWQGDYERIVIRSRVGWLETTPELADALTANTALEPFIVNRVSATGLLIYAEHMDALERVLLAAAELPVRSADPAAGHRSSIHLAADGRIEFVHRSPSIFARGRLQGVADETDAGWQVTRTSVARALKAGMDPAAIIAVLAELAAGGVPAPLQQQIKAWAGAYGSAAVRTVTVVQFRDQETLQELLADPALGRLLRPWPPKSQLGMAQVAPGDVAAVRRLLAERGVDVTD